MQKSFVYSGGTPKKRTRQETPPPATGHLHRPQATQVVDTTGVSVKLNLSAVKRLKRPCESLLRMTELLPLRSSFGVKRTRRLAVGSVFYVSIVCTLLLIFGHVSWWSSGAHAAADKKLRGNQPAIPPAQPGPWDKTSPIPNVIHQTAKHATLRPTRAHDVSRQSLEWESCCYCCKLLYVFLFFLFLEYRLHHAPLSVLAAQQDGDSWLTLYVCVRSLSPL